MGCRVCRARKVSRRKPPTQLSTRTNSRPLGGSQVKCDGRPNGCRNCERLQLDCVADDGTAAVATKRSSVATTVSLKKIRTYRSCTTCRLSKTKCDGDRPKCGRCTTKKVECIYDGGSAPRWTHTLEKPAQLLGSGNGSKEASPAEGLLSNVERERSAFLSGERRLPPRPDDTPSAAASDATGEGSLSGHEGHLNISIPDGQAWYVTSLPILDLVLTPNSLTHSNDRLVSPSLPAGRNLRRVVDQYFANLHPLRCFAFVHKPTFMRQLDKGLTTDDESALLHIVCAHGAK